MIFNMNRVRSVEVDIARFRIGTCPLCGTGANDPIWRNARNGFLWIKPREEGLYINCWKCGATSKVMPLYKMLEELYDND